MEYSKLEFDYETAKTRFQIENLCIPLGINCWGKYQICLSFLNPCYGIEPAETNSSIWKENLDKYRKEIEESGLTEEQLEIEYWTLKFKNDIENAIIATNEVPISLMERIKNIGNKEMAKTLMDFYCVMKIQNMIDKRKMEEKSRQ